MKYYFYVTALVLLALFAEINFAKTILTQNNFHSKNIINNTIEDSLKTLNIPPRNPEAISGSEFMNKVENMSFANRESEIFKEISSGNIPDFLRNLVIIETIFNDANGTPHTVKYAVMPDYLAIGSDEDFCRIPMGPITAQKLADLFGAVMPTRKLVNNIYQNAEIKLAPVTYAPIGNQNELVSKFVEHNFDIEQQRINTNGVLGQLVGGIKKDVVLSNKIIDPTRENHVVIYGWHKLDGNPIQPLTNIHTNNYVDYSHGIRFLNSKFLLDGEINDMRDILSTQVLYKILSDEYGIMSQPTYLTVDDLKPTAPKSFGVFIESENSIKIIIEKNADVGNYLIYKSKDGLSFETPFIADSNIIYINNLDSDTQYFIKIAAENEYGTSPESEVLSAVTSNLNDSKILIVNGFDRSSDGNTYNFIRQHAEPIWNGLYTYESATNDAVLDGIINLEDYQTVDYILGDESTADETFSNAEQKLIISYLQHGGNLFVSGSEIAWDLDYKGTSSDNNFIWDYLKAKYVADAPNNTQQTYYQAVPVSNTFFDEVPEFYFDNGTHGTINVKWPDVLMSSKGGKSFLKYEGFDTSYGSAGIYYRGIFPGGNSVGKIIVLGFPFETIYPADIRNTIMEKVLNFFYDITDVNYVTSENSVHEFYLSQNYPNPFNPTTQIEYKISKKGLQNVSLKVYNVLGEAVATLVNEKQNPGNYKVRFNGQNLPSGIYFYKLQTGNFTETKRMILVK